ncbi:MAG: transcription antitermination factor NusB [Lachnospiraceae bacterium]|nr:transcription antitermination factor NusB [Lachnospiraceae bacterium]
MNRHELRDRVFKLLFRIEFNTEEDMLEQVKLFCNDDEYGTIDEKDTEYVTAKYEAVLSRIEEIDKLINDNATGWDTKRMGKVDVTVLRLAVYEMCFDEDIPEGVAIDEAVEIAKTYGQETSGAFVNAILTKVKKAQENS